MNIEVICPVCGGLFVTAVTERETRAHGKRVTCSLCLKSFFLARASWGPLQIVTVSRILPSGQVKTSDSRRSARNKWSKKPGYWRVT